MAQRLIPLMTAFEPRSDQARDAVARLRKWDFRMDRDKVEPLVFLAWLRELALEIFVNRMGTELGREYWNLRPRVVESILTEHRDWCIAPCEDILSAALENALATLSRDYGADMNQWQYGRAHIAEFENRIVNRIPLLRDWLKVAIPTPGASDTVNVGPSSVHDPVHPYRQLFGAGLRIITDLANPREARMIAVPGQSGNPFSPHYDDLLTRWRDFGWLDARQSRACCDLDPGAGAMTDLPVTLADIRRAEAAIAGAVVRHAARPRRRAVGANRVPGLPEIGDAAGDRLVQGARRLDQVTDA